MRKKCRRRFTKKLLKVHIKSLVSKVIHLGQLAYSVASLARDILRNQRRIHPASVLIKGFYGIDVGEVFLSLPVQFGQNGVLGVTNVHLTDEEAQQLRDSAKTILEVQNQLGV